MKIVLCFMLFGAIACDDLRLAADNPQALQNLFSAFKAENHRVYNSPSESRMRLSIFRKFVKEAAKINSNQDDVNVGLTFFADLTEDEKKAYFGANVTNVQPEAETYTPPEAVSFRGSKSYKSSYGAVKSQGRCASCWAFGAVGAVEGHQSMAYGYTSMSEQQVLDCSGAGDCYNGGYHARALNYIRSRNFLTSTSSYRYTGTKGRCNTSGKSNSLRIRISRTFQVSRGDRNLLNALNQGPVAILLYNFHGVTVEGYKSGVITTDSNVLPGAMNHIMVAVGYTSNSWEIRNSWGSNWGDRGYFFHSRATHNNRGISDWAYTLSYTRKVEEEE